jgi:hypothetical protein
VQNEYRPTPLLSADQAAEIQRQMDEAARIMTGEGQPSLDPGFVPAQEIQHKVLMLETRLSTLEQSCAANFAAMMNFFDQVNRAYADIQRRLKAKGI